MAHSLLQKILVILNKCNFYCIREPFGGGLSNSQGFHKQRMVTYVQYCIHLSSKWLPLFQSHISSFRPDKLVFHSLLRSST